MALERTAPTASGRAKREEPLYETHALYFAGGAVCVAPPSAAARPARRAPPAPRALPLPRPPRLPPRPLRPPHLRFAASEPAESAPQPAGPAQMQQCMLPVYSGDGPVQTPLYAQADTASDVLAQISRLTRCSSCARRANSPRCASATGSAGWNPPAYPPRPRRASQSPCRSSSPPSSSATLCAPPRCSTPTSPATRALRSTTSRPNPSRGKGMTTI